MKTKIITIAFIIFMLAFADCQMQNEKNDSNDFPILMGPYLGQTPPGATPELFAPGIISYDEKAIVEQTIRNNLGWAKNKDFDLLRSTIKLDSTYLVVNPTDRVAAGEEDFRHTEEFFRSPDFQAVGFEISDLRINFSKGGDVAWFYCHLNDWNTWKGQPANWENARWTGVLEKIDGQWRIRQQHFSYAQ